MLTPLHTPLTKSFGGWAGVRRLQRHQHAQRLTTFIAHGQNTAHVSLLSIVQADLSSTDTRGERRGTGAGGVRVDRSNTFELE